MHELRRPSPNSTPPDSWPRRRGVDRGIDFIAKMERLANMMISADEVYVTDLRNGRYAARPSRSA